MTPRNTKQNQQIRDERREQILQAALDVFARKGISATKVADIAAAAGLSHGLVYHYFASKDEVFVVLVDRALEGAIQMARSATEQPGTPWEQLRWLTASIMRGSSEAPAYVLIMLQAFTFEPVPEAAKQLAAEKGPLIYKYTIPLIEAGQAAQQVTSGDPVKLTMMYYAIMQGLALGSQYSQCHNSDLDVDMVLRFLKAQGG